MIQGFLLRYRKRPEQILEKIEELLQSDENVKIEQYLTEVGCTDSTNEFKLNECFTLASARNLPKTELDKTTVGLTPLLKGRLLETIRMDRKLYIKSHAELEKFIEELT